MQNDRVKFVGYGLRPRVWTAHRPIRMAQPICHRAYRAKLFGLIPYTRREALFTDGRWRPVSAAEIEANAYD